MSDQRRLGINSIVIIYNNVHSHVEQLWKFQQQHRSILEDPANFGLKRWEIGEIASKIGQLYYHYYLRTSETNYLLEAYIFYDAIRDRAYFRDVLDVKNPGLMIKKLRFYARFIVVCMLLRKDAVVRTLLEELDFFVEEYARIYKAADSGEWRTVHGEISRFLEAETACCPKDFDGVSLNASSRVADTSNNNEDHNDTSQKLRIQEAVVVGQNAGQAKFSELSLDMYRILQCLEREPALGGGESGGGRAEAPQKQDSTTTGQQNGGADNSTGGAKQNQAASRRANPHKYLLYQPTVSQLLVYIATAFKEVGDHCGLLIYLTSDGFDVRAQLSDEGEILRFPENFRGGMITNSTKRLSAAEKQDHNERIQASLHDCLHPGDLLPYTRKPMFLIVESRQAYLFKSIPTVFNQPLVCLMAPSVYPTVQLSRWLKPNETGNLMTIFLNNPLSAFLAVSGVKEMSKEVWMRCLSQMLVVEKRAFEILMAAINLDKSYQAFLCDDFTSRFLARFIICYAVLFCSKEFNDPKFYPSCFPEIGPSILAAPELLKKLHDLAELCNVSAAFNFNETASPQ